ncbi:MAG: methyltransferase domain-containing protein [Candidatus Omnitrophica bacterium]|nr:methyltransferase domain-containing protein [Candidatus Omnitrophota bacterium]MBD3268630.1 methyltransferase domain-containing protein [Candidatus Omnitrophota bacterium]
MKKRKPVPPNEEAITDSKDLRMEEYSSFVKTALRRPYLRLIDSALSRIDSEKSLKILEIGCGPGWISLWLAKKNPGYRVKAIDISQDMLRAAENNKKKEGVSNVSFLNADAGRLTDLFGEKFDMVISNGSLQHWQNPLKVIRQSLEVLEKGGICVISDTRRDLTFKGKVIFRLGCFWLGIAGRRGKKMRKGWQYAVEHAYTPEELKDELVKNNIDDFEVITKPVLFTVYIRKQECF